MRRSTGLVRATAPLCRDVDRVRPLADPSAGRADSGPACHPSRWLRLGPGRPRLKPLADCRGCARPSRNAARTAARRCGRACRPARSKGSNRNTSRERAARRDAWRGGATLNKGSGAARPGRRRPSSFHRLREMRLRAASSRSSVDRRVDFAAGACTRRFRPSKPAPARLASRGPGAAAGGRSRCRRDASNSRRNIVPVPRTKPAPARSRGECRGRSQSAGPCQPFLPYKGPPL